MTNSEQYIIQRWRCYLESFAFTIKHIQGKHNLMADFQSRMFSITFDDDDNARAITYHQQHFTYLSVIYEAMNPIPLLDQYHLPTVTNDTSMIIIRDQNDTFNYTAPAHTPLSTIFN